MVYNNRTINITICYVNKPIRVQSTRSSSCDIFMRYTKRISQQRKTGCLFFERQTPLCGFSGQREDKTHGGGLGDSSSESGDETKRQSGQQQQQQQPSSCAVQQQQQQQQLVDHQQTSSMYQLPPPASVSVSSPHSYHQGHGSSLSHPHMQHHDTSSESGDDKRNLHHQLQHHLQVGTHGAHGLVHPTATLPPPPPSCAQQKSQLDYMQYYPQVGQRNNIECLFPICIRYFNLL